MKVPIWYSAGSWDRWRGEKMISPVALLFWGSMPCSFIQ